LNRTIEKLLCANDVNLLRKNKHTFCETNERGALVVASNEVSLVAYAEVKVGKIHNTKEGKYVIEGFNIWKQP